MNSTPLSPQAIRERAYSLWEQAGRPAGRDQEFWLRAEAELAAPAGTGGVPRVIAPPIIKAPPAPTASPAHQNPPPIKDAAKTSGRRPPGRRVPKRA